jgi:hypothetical protein
MKKIIFLLLSCTLLLLQVHGQDISGKLKFEQGQSYVVELETKTTIAQQAMGQAIDFTVNADARHNYKVTNTSEDNSTLHHHIKHIHFLFDGMGQKMSFDSEKEKDLNGMFGKTMKELLDKKYDIIVDSSGKVLMAIPEKITLSQKDSRMAIIISMLKEVMDLVQPPAKGTNSFFKILPDTAVRKGSSWTTSNTSPEEKFDGMYSIADINDTTIIVDYSENSVTVTKAEMMGSQTTTTLNNKSKGKIILDRATGLLVEKNGTTESNGTTEASFGSLPVTSKATTVIKVRKD